MPEDDDERVALHAYMGLFERIWLLVKKGILELDTVDSMYGFRAYTLVRNHSPPRSKFRRLDGRSARDASSMATGTDDHHQLAEVQIRGE